MTEPILSPHDRLLGWKRISNYLGCSERTARRWERNEGLPVHRQQHDVQASVYAYETELERWMTSRASAPDPKAQTDGKASRLWLMSGLAGLLALTIATFSFITNTDNNGVDVQASVQMSQDEVAVDLYERGRTLWLQRGKEPNSRAVKLLTEAVERDPDFAKAWEALASAWLTLPSYSDEIPTQTALDKALIAADRAISLDPNLLEPRTVMSSIAQRQGDWIASEQILTEALDADPDNSNFYLWLAGHYREVGMITKSNALVEEALTFDPNFPPLLTELGMNRQLDPDPIVSMKILDRLWNDIGFQTPPVWMGNWYMRLRTGDYDGALEWALIAPETEFRPLFRDYVEARRSSDPDRLEVMKDRVFDAYQNGFPPEMAYMMVTEIGYPDVALDVAASEAETGQFEFSVVMFDPKYPEPRKSERFADIVERLGYIDYWAQSGGPDVCLTEKDTPVCQRLLAQTGK